MDLLAAGLGEGELVWYAEPEANPRLQITLSNGMIRTGEEDEELPYTVCSIEQDRTFSTPSGALHIHANVRVIDQLISVMNSLMAPDRRLSRNGYTMKLATHGQELQMTALSYGEIALWNLLLDISNPEDEEIAYLIDMPELHLHVDVQRQLVKAIRQLNDRQLIIATHSPEIMADYDDEQMVEVANVW